MNYRILFQINKTSFVNFRDTCQPASVSKSLPFASRKGALKNYNNYQYFFLLENRAVVPNTSETIFLSLPHLLLGT